MATARVEQNRFYISNDHARSLAQHGFHISQRALRKIPTKVTFIINPCSLRNVYRHVHLSVLVLRAANLNLLRQASRRRKTARGQTGAKIYLIPALVQETQTTTGKLPFEFPVIKGLRSYHIHTVCGFSRSRAARQREFTLYVFVYSGSLALWREEIMHILSRRVC